jgi:hypothetical protein
MNIASINFGSEEGIGNEQTSLASIDHPVGHSGFTERMCAQHDHAYANAMSPDHVG